MTGEALGYATGLFVDGCGSISRRVTVIQELQRLQASCRVSNSRMTGRGRIDTLAVDPDGVTSWKRSST